MWLKVISVAVCLGIGLTVWGCETESPPEPGGQSGPFPDQILTDFEVDMTRGGLKSAQIAAERGVVYRKRDSMLLQDLRARLYDSQGQYSSTLLADSGLLRERRKRMLAHGDVRIESRDSLHLFSDSLFWYGDLTMAAPSDTAVDSAGTDDRFMVAKGNVHLVTRDSVHLWTDTLLWNDINRRVATDAFVTIVRSNNDTLQGYGLRSDDQLETITIQQSVTGTIRER
jgi:LPS export ABC transporter protein LptC